jgi:hypothetical protein
VAVVFIGGRERSVEGGNGHQVRPLSIGVRGAVGMRLGWGGRRACHAPTTADANGGAGAVD